MKGYLFKCVAMLITISQVTSAQMCPASFTQDFDKSFLISPKFLLTGAIKSVYIHLDHLFINIPAFVERRAHVR